jgi:thiosulfate/3-mercaptopyruvate sulfurtransferase
VQFRKFFWILTGLVPVFFAFCVVAAQAQSFSASADPSSALSIPLADQMQPAKLNQLLAGPAAAQPLVFQIGSHIMFQQAHIPGAQFVGPGSQPAGLTALAQAVSFAAKGRLIVLYCGCCPWGRCPNVAPAYRKLHELGYTNVKVLYLASNFGDDWVAKGYKTQNGN